MRRLPRLPPLVVALLMTAATQPMARAGTVLHVDDDAPPGGDGSTWRTALADLEAALALVAEVGSGVSEIRVAAGVYRPTRRTDPADHRSVTFSLVDGVALRGGYAGLSGPDPDQRDIDLYETILAGTTGYVVTDCCVVHATDGCDQKECAAAVCETLPECCDPAGSWDQACVDAAHPLCGCAPSFVNSYHVVTAEGLGPEAELDGFTISGGNTLFGDPGVVPSGAGFYGVDSSLTVRDCTFLGNTAASGGAMAAFGGAPVVIDCVFSANIGGGMLNSGSNGSVTGCAFLGNFFDFDNRTGMENIRSSGVVAECSFTGNSEGMHNVASSPVVTSCTFSTNVHAMHNQNSSPVVSDCQFTDNGFGVPQNGAAMRNRSGSHPMVTGCTFLRNRAFRRGGAMSNEASDPTVIDCLFQENVVEPDNVEGGGGAIWDFAGGATIISCTFLENTATSGYHGSLRGGAVSIAHGAPTIIDCTFQGNAAESDGSSYGTYGGGLFLVAVDGALVEGCDFLGNWTSGRAGGSYVDGIATVRGCRFAENTADGFAGGLYAVSTGSLSVTDCDFEDNRAPYGGGLTVIGETSVTGCRFLSNQAEVSGGGGMLAWIGAEVVATNCLFSGNTTTGWGGAVAVWPDDSQVLLAGCTLSANSAHAGGGGVHVGPTGGIPKHTGDASAELANCILWGNIDPNGGEQAQVFVDPAFPGFTASAEYSCIEGYAGGLGGAGNTALVPLFVDLDGPDDVPGTGDDDLRLLLDSPCIDAGLNLAMPPDAVDLDKDGDTAELTPLDLDGNPRFVDAGRSGGPGCGVPVMVDMGAYEHGRGPSAQPVPGDIDGDLLVSEGDLDALLQEWGPCPPCCLADLDRDGLVGMSDLLMLLAHWG